MGGSPSSAGGSVLGQLWNIPPGKTSCTPQHFPFGYGVNAVLAGVTVFDRHGDNVNRCKYLQNELRMGGGVGVGNTP